MEADDVTRLLAEVEDGSTAARERLVRVLGGELRRLAGAQMARQRADHTLQPTALVNEAYMRLFAKDAPSFESRTHFLAAAARAMRSVLVDMARRRGALRRGGDRLKVTLTEARDQDTAPELDLIDLNESLDRLAELDERWAAVVELRFFGGLTVDETAAALGLSKPTVYRAWEMARAWLRRELSR